MQVCHFTSVHSANDVRIFHKECVSLGRSGFDVHLVAKGHLENNSLSVTHHACSDFQNKNRFLRMLLYSNKIFRTAKKLNADIYHFHDPELLPYGLMLKLLGKKVIYDAHEDLPRDILGKTWIPKNLRYITAKIVELIENFIARRLDCVVTSTPHIRDRFITAKCNALDLNNYPDLNELLLSSEYAPDLENPVVCYLGLIAENRGIRTLLQAVKTANIKLRLAGRIVSNDLKQLINDPKYSQHVEYLGEIKREDLKGFFNNCLAGIVTLHPEESFLTSQPIKMYEYMSAGLPVIASDFPIWKKLLEDNKCGYVVDPLNPNMIADCIKLILSDPKLANVMSQNGQEIIKNRYNWNKESQKLIKLYQNFNHCRTE